MTNETEKLLPSGLGHLLIRPELEELTLCYLCLWAEMYKWVWTINRTNYINTSKHFQNKTESFCLFCKTMIRYANKSKIWLKEKHSKPNLAVQLLMCFAFICWNAVALIQQGTSLSTMQLPEHEHSHCFQSQDWNEQISQSKNSRKVIFIHGVNILGNKSYVSDSQ